MPSGPFVPFGHTIDVPLDSLVFVVEQPTFCAVDEIELVANLVMGFMPTHAELVVVCVLPRVLRLLGGGSARLTKADHTAYAVRRTHQVFSQRGA